MAARRDRRPRPRRARSCCSVTTSKSRCRCCYLRLRRAVVELGVPLVDLAPVAHGLSAHAAVVAPHRAGRASSAPTRTTRSRGAARRSYRARSSWSSGAAIARGVGRRRSSAPPPTLAARATTCASSRRCGAATCTARSTPASRPASCPAASPSTRGRDWFTERVGRVSRPRAASTRDGILRRRGRRQDPTCSCSSAPIRSATSPTPTLARRALDAVDTIIVVDGFDSESTRAGRRVPALHALGREGGHGHQPRRPGAAGRAQGRARRHRDGRLADRGRARARASARDLDLATVDEVTDEIARVAPALAGVDRGAAEAARATAWSLPLAAHRDEIVLRTRELSLLADDGSGTSWDPIKVEGESRPTRSPGRTDRCARRRRREAAESQPEPERERPRSTSGTGARAATRSAGPRRVRSAPRGGSRGSTTMVAWSRDAAAAARRRPSRACACSPQRPARASASIPAAR